VHDPLASAAALRGAFAEGIELTGGSRLVLGLPEGLWEEVARHQSDLATTLAVTNKRSQNFYAECLAKLLGRRLEGHGSWPAAVTAVARLMTRLGLEPASFQLADGSGLSRADEATPRAMTSLLERMYFHSFGRDFVRSLPYSGEDGFLARRLPNRPTAQRGRQDRHLPGSPVGLRQGAPAGCALSIRNQVRSNAAAHAAQDRIVRALIDRG
jgi:D-alanyl-D-alanine carboxypeptidase/D-alanyl-D-alanine-endopeptidase (penicillin-binding protein 4)